MLLKLETVKLIYPVAEESFSIRYYLQKEDIFHVIHDAHLAIGHGGRNRMIKETQSIKTLQQKVSCFTEVCAFLASKNRKFLKKIW